MEPQLTGFIGEDETPQVDAVVGSLLNLFAEHVLQLLRDLVLSSEHVHSRSVSRAPAVHEVNLAVDLDVPIRRGVNSRYVTW